MKILQINKFHYLRGGSERYVFELSRLLADNGHEVMHFSMADEKNYQAKFSPYFIGPVDLEKFNIINIIKFFYNREAAKKLEKLIKDERPDVAHLHNIAHQISPAIIKVLKKHNIPIVQTLHDYKLICPNARLFSRGRVCRACRGGRYYNCFLRKCSHNCRAKSFLAMSEAYLNNKILKYYDLVDIFIAPSRFMKDICVEFGVPENKIRLVYNFTPSNAADGNLTGLITDCQEDTVIPADKFFLDACLRRHDEYTSFQNEPAYLLYFGRLSEEKGIGVILEAMKKLTPPPFEPDIKSYSKGIILKSNCEPTGCSNKRWGVKLKIAGAGPDYKKCQLFINKHSLNGRVEFLGPKYGDELERLIKQAEAVILPSLWPENLPYSALESLALSKIVIAARIGGLPEIIQDGYNGLLFKSGSGADLAEKISLILTDERLAQSIETNARPSLNKFNSQDHYQAISRIYQNLV